MKLVAVFGLVVVLLSACGATPATHPTSAAKPAPGTGLAALSMTVYTSPTCSCCGRWIDYVRAQGVTVVVEDTHDVTAIKIQSKVPASMYSCHTTIVGGYVVEGHVPLEAIQRLLAERPPVVGIAVPGMPAGSPGMDGATPAPYDVMTFDAAGTSAVFMRIGE